jgi:hypothetical protein
MSFRESFVSILIAVTSVGAYFIGRSIGLKPIALASALREAVECIGAFAVFLAINLVLGLTVIFLIRSTLIFLSAYVLVDATLILFSALQGFVFHLWWQRSQRQ